jgi:uncharacterized membrane protein SpoIIM required for sporulation
MILPYIVKVIESEKIRGSEKIAGHLKLLNIFQRHNKTILVFIFMFLGMVVEYTLLFAFVPPEIGNAAFENQLKIVFGEANYSGGYFFNPEFFWLIVLNNVAIVIIAFVLSLFYGSGAIFILNYNASIAGIIYGSGARALVWGVFLPIAGNPILYLPHTILEILGFLLAAVAGSIIMKSQIIEHPHEIYMKDSLVILAAAIILIFVAAFVEVTVPFMF